MDTACIRLISLSGCGAERLENYAGQGPTKKAAKERAAEAVALSGHCVR